MRKFSVVLIVFAILVATFPVNAQSPDPVSTLTEIKFRHWQSRIGMEASVPMPTENQAKIESAIVTQSAQGLAEDTRIVFQSYRDGNWEIYRADGDGSDVKRLTSNPASDVRPKLSFNGQKIVFASNRDGNYEIYSMNWDGTGLTRLTTTSSGESYPTWSPDETKLAFVSDRDGNLEIYTMNVDGSMQTRITNTRWDDFAPDWSPIGQRLLWITADFSTGDTELTIYDFNVAQGYLASYRNCKYMSGADWSSGGTRIAFDCDIDKDGWNEVQYLTVSIQSQSANFIDLIVTRVYDPNISFVDAIVASWSPDDVNIVFIRTSYSVSNNQLVVRNRTVSSVALQQEQPHVLSINTGLEAALDWRWNDTQSPTHSGVRAPGFVKISGRMFEEISVEPTGRDAGASGIFSYDLESRIEDGEWNREVTGWPFPVAYKRFTPADVIPQPRTMYFRTRMRDGAGHVGPWSDPLDASAKTTFFWWQLRGSLTDNRNVAGISATVGVSPGVPCTSLNTASGQFACYMSPVTNSGAVFDITWGATGYGNSLQASYRQDRQSDAVFRPYLFSGDNIAVNGSFSGSLTGWQIGGWVSLERIQLFGKLDDVVNLRAASRISQSMTVESTLTKPTLAFIAVNQGEYYQDDIHTIEVSVHDAVSNTTVISQEINDSWQLYWADLSAWSGKAVTVEIRNSTPYTTTHPSIYIDDVSLSSWLTPKPLAISPSQINSGVANIELAITGENFIAPVSAFVGSTLLTNIQVVDDKTIKATLQSALTVGRYPILIRNAGGQSVYSPQLLQVGHEVFMPMLTNR